ncbi:MAG: hypothetical protein JRN42_07175 [Nitrososphaerota archaeon]|nr:hypothetical protein [Nitrososphaerota archaeon]
MALFKTLFEEADAEESVLAPHVRAAVLKEARRRMEEHAEGRLGRFSASHGFDARVFDEGGLPPYVVEMGSACSIAAYAQRAGVEPDLCSYEMEELGVVGEALHVTFQRILAAEGLLVDMEREVAMPGVGDMFGHIDGIVPLGDEPVLDMKFPSHFSFGKVGLDPLPYSVAQMNVYLESTGKERGEFMYSDRDNPYRRKFVPCHRDERVVEAVREYCGVVRGWVEAAQAGGGEPDFGDWADAGKWENCNKRLCAYVAWCKDRNGG